MANTKVQGSYHGFKVTAEINDEGVKVLTVVDSEGAARTKLAGKSFPNARQAGRAAFDAITDYEKLPRLPDARFMTLKANDGKTVSARVAKPATAKAKTSKSEPAEVVSKTGVRKSNPAANKSKNAKASAARKPSAVKTTAKDKASPKSVSSSKGKSSTKSAARKVSSGAEDLDI